MGAKFDERDRGRRRRFRAEGRSGTPLPSDGAAMGLERGDASRPAGSNVPLIARLV